MFEILPGDGNLKRILTKNEGFVEMNGGGFTQKFFHLWPWN